MSEYLFDVFDEDDKHLGTSALVDTPRAALIDVLGLQDDPYSAEELGMSGFGRPEHRFKVGTLRYTVRLRISSERCALTREEAQGLLKSVRALVGTHDSPREKWLIAKLYAAAQTAVALHEKG